MNGITINRLIENRGAARKNKFLSDEMKIVKQKSRKEIVKTKWRETKRDCHGKWQTERVDASDTEKIVCEICKYSTMARLV